MNNNLNSPFLLEAREVVKVFKGSSGLSFHSSAGVKALDRVSLAIPRGQTLGLVGESGSGKTTLGRVILQLLAADSGSILFDGVDLAELSPRQLKPYRRRMQIVFQDPYGSLNPRMRVEAIIAEGMEVFGLGTRRTRLRRVEELLELVGMSVSDVRKYPHEFSGGQRQRIGIARALALEPEFIVCDEPVSSLDVSVQAQVLNLLADLQRDLGLTCLFIAHDLGVVENMADSLAVMYRGKIVEEGPADEVYARPLHPYTRLLLDSIPVPDPDAPDKPVPAGPEAGGDSSGCVFYSRCACRQERCRLEAPRMPEDKFGHRAACFRAGECLK